MPRNKGGLDDLKRLRQIVKAAEEAPETPKPAPRKRHRFIPPGTKQTRPVSAHSSNTLPSETPAQLSEDDRKLFQRAMRHVEQMKDPGRVLLKPIPVAPRSLLEERRMRAAGIERLVSDEFTPAASEEDDSYYLKVGHGTDVLRGLKRGKWPVGASRDLHGSTLDDARERLDRFLASCMQHEVKCVRIVHGKGHGSADGNAVLKTTVRRWLTQLPEVIAYTGCNEADGVRAPYRLC